MCRGGRASVAGSCNRRGWERAPNRVSAAIQDGTAIEGPRPDPTPMQLRLDNRPLVLVVDDDARSAGLLARMLCSDGYEAEVTTDGAAAIARLTRSPVPEALVTDFHLPHADGLAVGKYARSRRSAMPIIMVTGYPQSLQAAVDPLDHPPIVLLTEPLDYPELLRRLATALGVPADE
jgi:CheY-like chemotaxis protein